MNNLYANKYRTDSVRLKSWNYANNGYYFITICTYNKHHLFGEIKNLKMVLSDIGEIVKDAWYDSFKIREELTSDAFVIMPNHIHAIVIIDNPLPDINEPRRDAWHASPELPETDRMYHQNQDTRPSRLFYKQSSGYHRVSLRREPKSLSSFVAGFKSAVTSKSMKKYDVDKIWQSKFHDHIIRNETDYQNIKHYVETNVLKWEEDRYF